jgi:tRNA-dihydrouridine synthase 2
MQQQDGMGAALLDNEAGAAGLIRALRAALPPHLPVTAKIRLLESPERTLAFAKAMEAAGCSALGVHMR